MESQLLGVLLALASAVSWGGGDFAGGMATRRNSQFQVLFITTTSSLLLLILFAILWNEGFPTTCNTILAFGAGIAGALGLAALYKGLSTGKSALIAPVAGVIGAIIPMMIGFFVEGFPSPIQLIGFGLALLSIWIVTRSSSANLQSTRENLTLAVLAGIGFGGFLGLIAQVDGEQVFTPLVVAKTASVLLAISLLKGRNQSFPNPLRVPVAIVSGVLDTGGNLLYLFATHYTRLDVVAVLASLYPAGTVLLSIVILKENVSVKQWIGILVCIIAIIIIANSDLFT